MNEHDKYNPNNIISAANAKLQQHSDWEGGQLLFQSALLQWVDDARELQGQPQAAGRYEGLREALATLWVAYCHFLASAHQFKSATEAYEQAVHDPVAGDLGRLWLDYAAFLCERSKFRNAQDVYLRALVGKAGGNGPAVTDEQDSDILWQTFLEMMRQQKENPDLTLEELKAAVATNEPVASMTEDPEDEDSAMEPERKRIKVEGGAAVPDAAPSSGAFGLPSVAAPPEPAAKVHVVIPEATKAEETAFMPILAQPDLPPDLKAAWMVRDGTGVAQPPEPPLFLAAPPKLSDPSGKDLLGRDLALELTQTLLSPAGNLVLQVCRALWTMSALQERESGKRLDALDESLIEAHGHREADWANRLSVAAEANESSIHHMIGQERHNFAQSCRQERERLFHAAAWEARRLLCAQQIVLAKLRIPTFTEDGGTTVDSSTLARQATVCAFLHSAFYLRQRIGTDPHLSMLASQAKRLAQLPAGGMPPPRVTMEKRAPASPPMTQSRSRHPPPQQQQQMYHNPPPPGYGNYPPQQQQQPMYGGGGYGAYPPQQQQPMHAGQQQQMMHQQQHPSGMPPPPPGYGGPPQYPYYQ
jgi:hypothetical protein